MIYPDHAALCLLAMLTTKPGDKYRSIQRPRVYRALRKRGYSKEAAARISNAQAPGHTVKVSAAVPAVIPPTGTNALFNQPGIESRRARLRKRKIALKAPNYGARAGQVIIGGLSRANDGKFTSTGGGGSSGASPRKPEKPAGKPAKTPKKTPEQRNAERAAKLAARAAERAAARDAAYRKLNIAPDGQAALESLRTGDMANPDAIQRAGLEDAGLVERDTEGKYHLTASGRATVNAASRGDTGRAGDTIAGARDRLRARRERIAERDRKKRERLERTKAAGTPGDYLVVEDREKPSTWHLQVRRNGKIDHRLLGAAWAALHSGFRGNTYQGPQKAEALAKLKRLYAAEKMPLPGEKSFTVFKDATGHDRWLAVSSTAYRDRDGEIVSRKALQQAVETGDSTGQRGPLRFWHVPGLDIGQCDYQATAHDGRFLIESGTFTHPAYAAAVKTNGAGYQVSIGFLHPETQPDLSGVFHDIAIFERSIVPPGRAANPFTQIRTKEQRMLSMEKLTALKALLGETPELAALLTQVQQTDKDAQARGTAYKDTEAEKTPILPPEITIGGIIYAVKAFPPAAVEEEKAPPEEMVEAATEMVEEPVEEALDDGPLLTDPDLDAIAERVFARIAPLLDMEKKMRGYMDEMKAAMGGMVAQKDATEAEQNTALAAAQKQLAELTARLKELEGDQPAGGYRASQRAESALLAQAMKDAGQLPGLAAVGATPSPNGLTTPEEQAAYKLLWGE